MAPLSYFTGTVLLRDMHVRGRYKDEGKTVQCPRCVDEHKVSKYASPKIHDMHCVPCKAEIIQEADTVRWAGKSEPEDFVTCRVCGYRAENLTSHIQNSHPDLVGKYIDSYPDAFIVALSSSIRDKTALRGRPLSEETRAKMSENAGRWNAGLTKADHPSLASQAEKMLGHESWNIGRTKYDHPSIKSTSEKLKQYVGDNRPWDNGLAANLTLEDLVPYMRDGKVVIGSAMVGLHYSYPTIRKECERLGVPVYKFAISQTLCCDTIAKLVKASYKSEWNDPRFTNVETGRRFRYDGYFEDIGLVVEVHGYQHWTFPSVFFPYEELRSEWEAMLKRDRIKRELIEETPDLTFLCIRGDEPFLDPDYLRLRLKNVGIST